jgi:hypothetical protein
MKLFLLFLFAVVVCSPSLAQSAGGEKACQSTNRAASSYGFERKKKAFAGSNEPKEMPADVIENISRQLRTKIGDEAFQKLSYQHLRAVDFDSSTPLSFADRRRIDAYELHFDAHVDETSSKTYVFTVGTNQYGQFLHDPQLPDIAANTERGRILPCRRAIELGYETGYLDGLSGVHVEIKFEPKEKVFIWDIYAYQKSRGLVSNHVWLNANSGSVIKTFQQYEPF